MKWLKAAVASLLVVFPAVTEESTAQAATATKPLEMYLPTDIQGHWAASEVMDLVMSDIVNGYVNAEGDVTVKPNASISRGEFVTLLIRALDIQSDPSVDTKNLFRDVKDTDFFSVPVQMATGLHMINGYQDGTFRPHNPIKRAEVASLIYKGFQKKISFNGAPPRYYDTKGHWAENAIEQISLSGSEIMKGYTETPYGSVMQTFRPEKLMTRAEAIVTIKRVVNMQNVPYLTPEELYAQVVIDGEKKYLKAMDEGRFDELEAINDQYNTGYLHAYNRTIIRVLAESYQEAQAQGHTIDYEVHWIKEPFAPGLIRGEYFATVFLEECEYEVITKVNGEEVDRSVSSIRGEYLMMKDQQTGAWKNYGFIPQPKEI
ncbi:S-layer homology domain-containing protein [Ammoniphilus resinae]|uniref:SLH domain-containing protein n=1 Tax=Ammoniphilus resinae TaxID=861532 RepID=A0ABS4GWR9_9BACL|nr:S-layer homology domain-containing protein [Ammoniphilus resinae]MBP1934713.1 hypothetical protein [Ammoniphilus resinae]